MQWSKDLIQYVLILLSDKASRSSRGFCRVSLILSPSLLPINSLQISNRLLKPSH